MEFSQIEGDVFRVLPLLPPNHFHGAIADPPYLWNFGGRAFDRIGDSQAGGTNAVLAMEWNLRWLRDLHRVLVPGGYVAVFQGSKTAHRLAYAAELAGFEVLPMLVGITGQAMAQGWSVGKLIDRAAGAEREVVGLSASKPGLRGPPSRSNSGESVAQHADITAPATPLRLLVPFSGVGSEVVGAAQAGWPEITAIEKNASYVAQGACRIRAWGPYSLARAGEISGPEVANRRRGDQGELW